MRFRENKPTSTESMATTREIEGREHLHRLIFERLGEKGVVVTNEMIHVSHYGFDERINWDEYIIVVDRFGVFGFTDGPCPYAANDAALPSGKVAGTTAQQFSAEVESAYGDNNK